MDEMSDDLVGIVREIQSSNCVILKRLNQLVLTPDDENCKCSCKKETNECRTELEALQLKLAQLDGVAVRFEARIKNMEQRLETFETSLMAIQTDDSKLKSERFRKERELREVQRDNLRHESSVASQNSSKENDYGLEKLKHFDQSLQQENKPKDGLTNQSVAETERKQKLKDETKHNSAKMETDVEVVEQHVPQYYDDDNYWRTFAHLEVKQGKEQLKDLEGVHSVICLDISSSMAKGNAWKAAKTFVMDYLNGLEEIATKYGLCDDHVALVTFGHETKVHKRLTNKYEEIREVVEHIRLGGPTPLYGGIVLSIAAAASSSHQVQRINFVPVFTKIIIITDGHLTDQRMYAGPDISLVEVDRAKAKIIEGIEESKSSQLDLFIVPVGQSDLEFLNLINSVAEGTMLDCRTGRQLARRTYLMSKMVDPLGLGLLGLTTQDSSFSTEDKKTMDEIRTKARRDILRPMERVKQDMYGERDDGDFPPIGSRVRRGPDWQWKEQDSHGPGTVIGHNKTSDEVWVEWDADEHQNVYRYGNASYDVLIVDEPRVLKKGEEVAVGCVVKPGKDRPVQKSERGVVIKLDKDEKKATIRWSSGERSECSYGKPGKQEFVVCSGFQPFETSGYVLGSSSAAEPKEEVKTKNKNKNFNF